MALAPTRQPYRFTVEEYLAFERASEERHEYLDGVIYAMAGSPEALLNLSQRLYPWLGDLQSLIPVHDRFLWLNLGQPDTYYIMPVLVAASMQGPAPRARLHESEGEA